VLVIVMSTVPVPVGDVAVQDVDEEQLTLLAALVPNLTVVEPGTVENPVPVRVTTVPPDVGPEVGETELTVGAVEELYVNSSG
jgi:hypothetical protein